ncbi:MAG: DNA polymerase III subunit alpha [Rhodospirillaceae bacterium]|jgi:DNA polymerase III subunit alpha|nr:DNA polymerase III subunit alpha [Rhodospirillaceae bacterium]MBT7954436.1 DNA polymerase III subunit alpha [Rhodospirillaceae bacterium]
MSHAEFVHLRVHSAYSLLEGALKVKDLVQRTKDLNMPAVAITDTGNLFGALEFSETCRKEGIQPIIGGQLDVTPYRLSGDDENRMANKNASILQEPDQIVLLAQNEAGYRNILKLVSQYHLAPDGEGEPRISVDDLAAHNEGVIAFTGGSKGGVGRLLAEGQNDAAEELLTRLKEIFVDRLYVEIQRHNLPVEIKIEAALIDLAYKHNLPLIATNECFFDTEDKYEAHDALICIAAGAYVDQSGRRRLTVDHRFKSPQEMRALFADLPEAVDNTLVVAERCAVMSEPHDPLLPAAPKEIENEGKSDAEVLAELAKAGLDERLEVQVYQDEMDTAAKEIAARPYVERMEYELEVITEMGFPGYFLIVADFIKWSKQQEIPVGPGRGSGAGSVVAWALTITDLDPLRFGLLFERFLNPERVSMPDFDIDFCQDRRDEVIHYVQDKYGDDRVAQIITFGTLQPRAALRDVGRVLQMPYPQVDRICKLVPNNPAAPVTLQQAIDGEPALQEEIKSDNRVAKLVDIAKRLEGLYRHASTHAAGVVIGDRPLDELVPLYRDPRSDMPVTQFSMKWVEPAGLVKFDFLGLKTLTVLAKALDHLKARNIEIDIDNLPFDDPATFEMLGKGDTTGVFQLESSGMRDILRNMKPDSFEDIIAIVALYRPGPMDNIPSYIRRKHGEEAPDYLYPNLEPILKETYGIMIYQEQVMQIAQELAGYSLGGADLLRRAMGKKIKAEMDAQRKNFVEGSVAKSVPEQKASDIFDQVAKFAGYGFNKSHAAAYALVAYQTAYLKANYPVEFMAASMTLDMQNTDKLYTFKQELERLNIDLLPPNINKSGVTFTVEETAEGGAVRYALAAIKNVGEGAMQTVINDRDVNGDYQDVSDLANRLDTKSINKRQVENLIRSGAMDVLNPNRKQMLEGVAAIVSHAGAAQQERESDQIGLFGAEESVVANISLPEISDWLETDRLKEEFDAIGFYLSAHPLDSYGKALERLKISSYAQLEAANASGPVKLAGMVISKKERISAKGNKYAFVQLSDASGSFEVTVFADVLSAARELLEAGNKVIVNAAADNKDQFKLLANRIASLDEATAKTSAGLKIYVDDAAALGSIKEILDREGRGKGDVMLVSRIDMQTEVETNLPDKYAVSPAMAQAVKAIPGIVEVREV